MTTLSDPPGAFPTQAAHAAQPDAAAHQRAVAALQERERELSQLIDMVPSHIWRLAPDGEPTFFNKPMVDFLGLDVVDIGEPGSSKLAALLKTVVHPSDAQSFRDVLHTSLRTGEALSIKYRLRRADGSYRWMSSRASPLRDDDGHILHWYGLCHDIDDLVKTEDKLRSSQHQLQQIVDAVPVSIWCATPEGKFSYMNRRYQEFLGFSQEELHELTQLAEADTIPKRVHPDDVEEVVRNLSSCFSTGAPFVARYRLRAPDGSWRWSEGRAEALRDEAGAIVQWYGAALDVDDEVRAQQALREREQELSQLVNMVPSYIWRLGADGEPTFFNQRLIDYFGLDIGEYDKPDMVRLAAAIHTFVHPEDADNVGETLQHSLASGESFHMKYRLRRSDGVYRWMAARAEPMRDAAGRIVQWYGLVQDIDDELRAQQALRDSERLLRQLVETLPAMIDCATPNGEPIYRSKGLSEYLGYQLEELDGSGKSRLNSTLDGGVHPDDVEGVKQQYAHSLATGEPYMRKHRLRRFDGEYRWVETRAAAMRNVDGTITQWSVICLDIDEEVRAQQALRDREREMSQLVAMLPSYVWRLTPEGEPNFFNKRLLDLLGLDGESSVAGLPSLGAIMGDVIHPDDASGLAAGLHRSLVSGEPFSMRYRMRRADGAYRWMSGHAEPMRDGEGQIIQWYGISHDIDDQLRAEQVLRESERHLQQLIDALPTLIWATTPDGEPSYLNKRLVKQVGLTLDDLDQPDRSRLQSAIRDSVHPDDAPGVQQGLFHSFTSGEPFAMRYRHRRADGVYHWMDTRAEPQRDPDGRIVQWYGVMFDIDDQVRAQEELRRTRERLAVASQAASLAELSASIAHEVNQPLAAVIANSHACQRWLGGESPNIQRATLTVERIIRDANAAAEVVRRIRALFKQSTEARSSFQLQLVIAEAAALMMADAARKRIAVQTELDADVPELVFDRVQLQQVLVNLLRNGIEAIEDGEGPRSLAVRAHKSGDEVRVEVSDSGGGLTHPDRIFEPFFTTKESGMGMGLSICRSIVESHGGKLWAETNDLNGTTFVFTLPLRSVDAA